MVHLIRIPPNDRRVLAVQFLEGKFPPEGQAFKIREKREGYLQAACREWGEGRPLQREGTELAKGIMPVLGSPEQAHRDVDREGSLFVVSDRQGRIRFH